MHSPIRCEMLDFLRHWLSFRYSRVDIPGFSVAIALRGEVLFSEAYGYSNLESQELLTSEHCFRIASHSKTFTATAVMQLVEQGKLSLESRVVEFLPWLSDHRDIRVRDVTVRQLLSHSSGLIRDGVDCDYWALERIFPSEERLRDEIVSQDLVIENNLKMKYSNYGYGLLGLLIAVVSGKSYDDYVRESIIRPLGLVNTGPEYDHDIGLRMVTGYTRAEFEHKRIPIACVQTGALASATGFYSTPRDLCNYFSAHFVGSGQLLSDESKKAMQTAQWLVDGCAILREYGLGLAIEHVGERTLFGHSGEFPGQSTCTLADAKDGLVISVMTNCIDGSARQIVRGIYSALDFIKEHRIEDYQGSVFSCSDLSKFRGRFVNIWSYLDILPIGDKLFAFSEDSWTPFSTAEELVFIDDRSFKIARSSSYSSEGELVHFEFSPSSRVKWIRYSGMRLLPADEYLKAFISRNSLDIAS